MLIRNIFIFTYSYRIFILQLYVQMHRPHGSVCRAPQKILRRASCCAAPFVSACSYFPRRAPGVRCSVLHMLQCVVVCFCAPTASARSALQCVVLHFIAACCSVLQCVALCCNVMQRGALCGPVWQCVAVCCSALQYFAVCCSVLQCVAVCCSVLQCVAMCGSVL